MTYFSPETCKQLEQLGCVASSGMWWVSVDAPMLPAKYIGQPLQVDYVLVPENECEFKIWDEEGLSDYFPAYSTSDFLASPEAKENWLKVIGQKKYKRWEHCDNWFSNPVPGMGGKTPFCMECGKPMDLVELDSDMQYQITTAAKELLDIILSGGDGESFIKEALEES